MCHIDSFFTALQIGVIAYVYAEILVEPGQILFWLKYFLKRWLVRRVKVRVAEHIPEVLANDEEFMKTHEPKFEYIEVERWLYKPLIGCSKCVAGQASLWVYVGLYRYSVLDGLFCISVSILTTLILIYGLVPSKR